MTVKFTMLGVRFLDVDFVKGGATAWSASRSQCRMEAPGRVRGMKRRHEPRGQPHFALPPNLYNGPPGRGTFWFQIFIQASSPETWRKTISGGEEVLAGKWGGLFLGYLLGKNFRRRDRDRLVPPRWMDAAAGNARECLIPEQCRGSAALSPPQRCRRMTARGTK